MSRARRVDNNQAEIVAALRDAGCSVHCTHTIGNGFPDLVVGFTDSEGRRCSYLLEVKSARGKLTKDEQRWHDEWRGHVAIVRSPIEALEALDLVPF